MFEAARAQVARRILEGRRLLALARTAGEGREGAAAACRGLLFVHLYGAYEYSVRAAVQAALDAVEQQSLSCGALRRSLLTLVLDPQWRSAEDVGTKGLWDSRLELVGAMGDAAPIRGLDSGLFPADGTHYRPHQLWTIQRVFGMEERIVPEGPLIGRIHELVDKRNEIAHGRSTATEVGGRFTSGEMERRIEDTEAIARHVIGAVEGHCGSGGLMLGGEA